MSSIQFECFSDNKKAETQQNFSSITWLKALATLLITNSHCTSLWGNYPFLSFGGLFGNCLFFFISGFCLAYPQKKFLPWITSRIKRVYWPYVCFIPILIASGYVFLSYKYILFPIEPYHFIPTIIALYPFYYFVTKIKNIKSMVWITISVVLCQLVYFFFYMGSISVTKHFSVLGLLSYFTMMLMGNFYRRFITPQKHMIACLGVIVFFFLYAYQSFNPINSCLAIFQWYLAWGVVVSLAHLFISFESKLKRIFFIDLLATHTLEIYIVQKLLIISLRNLLFPVGIILSFGAILGNAVVLKKISDFIMEMLCKLITIVRNKNVETD